jgi:hypothetical protein
MDFNLCNSITEIIRREKIDSHKTELLISNDGFTRIGTSAQISKRLIQVVTKARCMKVERKHGLYYGINALFEEYFKK